MPGSPLNDRMPSGLARVDLGVASPCDHWIGAHTALRCACGTAFQTHHSDMGMHAVLFLQMDMPCTGRDLNDNRELLLCAHAYVPRTVYVALAVPGRHD